MKTCPVCTTPLQAVDRQGIEIDHCPRCRGVWLDRGELEKIVERSAQYYAGHERDDDSEWGDDRRKYGGTPPGQYPPPGSYPPKKKEGFFGRLFDFD